MSEWIEYDGSDEQLTMLLSIPKHFVVDSTNYQFLILRLIYSQI